MKSIHMDKYISIIRFMPCIGVMFILMNTICAFSQIKIHQISPTQGQLGQKLSVQLFGQGFDETIRASMIPDFGGKRTIIKNIETERDAISVLLSGSTAFILCGDSDNNISIYDISTQSQPILVDIIEIPGKTVSIEINKNFLCVAFVNSKNDSLGQVMIYDITVPVSPVLIKTIEVPNRPVDLEFYNDQLCILTFSDLYTIQLEHDYKLTSINLPIYTARSIAISEDNAYVIDYQKSQLYVIDLTTQTMTLFPITGTLNNIYIKDHLAAIANSDGLVLLNISDASQITQVSEIKTPGRSQDVIISGSIAYIADSESGVQMIDISDPTTPKVLGWVDTPGLAINLSYLNNFLYVADWKNGIQIINVSDPTSSEFIGHLKTNGNALGLYKKDNYIYLADGNNGLCIIDVNHPLKSDN